jgi:hypothetical protein
MRGHEILASKCSKAMFVIDLKKRSGTIAYLIDVRKKKKKKE